MWHMETFCSGLSSQGHCKKCCVISRINLSYPEARSLPDLKNTTPESGQVYDSKSGCQHWPKVLSPYPQNLAKSDSHVLTRASSHLVLWCQNRAKCAHT